MVRALLGRPVSTSVHGGGSGTDSVRSGAPAWLLSKARPHSGSSSARRVGAAGIFGGGIRSHGRGRTSPACPPTPPPGVRKPPPTFWIRIPGECEYFPALNSPPVSDHLFRTADYDWSFGFTPASGSHLAASKVRGARAREGPSSPRVRTVPLSRRRRSGYLPIFYVGRTGTSPQWEEVDHQPR